MNKWIRLAIVLVVCVIIIMPMLLQNDIVQTIRISSDMRAHTDAIRAVGNGEYTYSGYYGPVILAYLLKPFANSEGLDTIYLWFNFAMLIAIAFTLYYVVRGLMGKKPALLVVPVTMLCATGILALFKYGVIFSIVNMYVILPFAIYFAIKWLDNRGLKYLVFAIILFALFSVFHYTSIYLPYAVGCSLAIYVVYAFVRHRTKTLLKVLPFAVGLVVMNMILASFFLSGIGGMQVKALSQLLPSVSPTSPSTEMVEDSTTPPSTEPSVGTSVISFDSLRLLVMHLSVPTMALLCLVIGGLVVWREEIIIDRQGRIWLFILGSFSVVLLGGLLTLATAAFNRLAVDLATMMAIATACLLGVIMQNKKSSGFNALVIIVVVGRSSMTLIPWVS